MSNRVINYWTVIIYFLILLIITTVYSFLIDYNYLPPFFYITIDQAAIRDLINTIWQVQAAVSLLSVTLVSLLINKLDTHFYGISVKEVLLIKHGKIRLNYWDKVLLCILLIASNFFYVSKGILSGASLFFIINSVLIVIIFIDTFALVVEDSKFKITAKEYFKKVLENYLSNLRKNSNENIFLLINNLSLHCIQLNQRSNLIELRDNIYFLFFLWEYSNQSNGNKIIQSEIENKLKYVIQNMIESDNIFEVYNIIRKIFNEKASCNNISYLVQVLLEKLVEGVLLFKNRHQFDKYNVHSFIEDITTDKSGKSVILDNQTIAFLLSRYFVNIQNNTHINDKEKKELTRLFINWITHISYKKEESDEYYIYREVIFHIARYTIKYNRAEDFGNLVSEIYINNRLGLTKPFKEKHFKILSTIGVYLYYVSLKEKYYKDDYRNSIKEYIFYSNSDNTNDKPKIYYIIANSNGKLWYFYSEIRNQLTKHNWEKIPINDTKSCIMNSVIDEFFVYYSLCYVKDFTMYEIGIDKLDSERIRILLEYFNSDGTLKEEYREDFKLFCEWLKIKEEIPFVNKKFYEYLNVIYKQNVLNEVIECRKMSEVIHKREQEYIDKINEAFRNSIFFVDKILNKNVKEFIVCDYLTVRILAGKVTLIGDVAQNIVQSFEHIVFEHIKKRCVIFKYDYRESKKISKLIDIINELKNSKNLNINSYINRSLSGDHFINYYEDSSEKEKLKDFENKLEYLGNLDNKYTTIFLDKDKIDIKIELVSASFRDLTLDEIHSEIESLGRDGDYYLINIVNDIKGLFTKEEAETYYKENFRLLEVRCKIYTRLSNPCGIIIEHD